MAERLSQLFRVNKELNPKIFKKEKMRPDVRKHLLKVVRQFLEFTGIKVPIKDVTLTGSSAGYSYNDLSDLDVHVVFDSKKLDMLGGAVKELFSAKSALFNDSYDAKLGKGDIELYYQDSEEEHTSDAVYSIKDDMFLKEPTKGQKVKANRKEVLEKADDLKRMIDYMEAKLASGKSIEADIKYFKEKLKKMRQRGLDAEGIYSPENLAFKVLRNDGYLAKLKNLNRKDISKKLTLSEGVRAVLSL